MTALPPVGQARVVLRRGRCAIVLDGLCRTPIALRPLAEIAIPAMLDQLLFAPWGSIGWRQVLALLLAAAAVMGSPGPATISLSALGAAFGVRSSLSYLAGIILGTTTVLVAVAVGIVVALLSVPHVAPVLITVSAAYILYLAYRIATAPPLADETRVGAAPKAWGGLILGVLNPKAYVAIGAVFASAELVSGAPVADAVAKVGVLAAMIVAINTTWLFAGAAFAHVFRDPATARVVNVGFAVALVVATALAFL